MGNTETMMSFGDYMDGPFQEDDICPVCHECTYYCTCDDDADEYLEDYSVAS